MKRVLKVKAKARGIPYTRDVRMLLENDVARPPALAKLVKKVTPCRSRLDQQAAHGAED